MEKLIERPNYLNQLIENKDVDLVKVVTGIRRCGKSSLMTLFHNYLVANGVEEQQIIHMNLESLNIGICRIIWPFMILLVKKFMKIKELICFSMKCSQLGIGRRRLNHSDWIMMLISILPARMLICYLVSFLLCYQDDM